MLADGSYTFTPVAGFSGPVEFPYTTADNNASPDSSNATIHIIVQPVVPAPKPDVNQTYVNVPVTGDVSTNDENIPSGSTYGTPAANASNPGTALPTVNPDGTYTFTTTTPGVYTFQVPVTLPDGSIKLVELVITVLDPTSTTNKPVANVDLSTTPLNTATTLATLSNDQSGNPGVALVPGSVTVTDAPASGTTSVNATTGAITYTPNTGFVGTDTLTYSVTDANGNVSTAKQIITVLPAGAANTTTSSDDYATTPANTAVTGNAITNDKDPNGDAQTVVPQTTTIAGKGTLTLLADGSYTFTPVAGFSGPVEFPYTTADNNASPDSSQATIHIIVQPAPPIATNDVSTYFTNVPKIVNVLANDTTGAVVSPTRVSIIGGTSPDAEGENLTKVVAGEGTWTVNPTTGEITFTPETGYTGDPTPVQYTVKSADGTVSNQGTVTLTNDPTPAVVVNDTQPYKFGVPKTVSVLLNDSTGAPLDSSRVTLVPSGTATSPVTDAQGDVIGFTEPGQGTWTVNPTSGAITFTPESGFAANPTPVVYQARTFASTLSNTATVTLAGVLSVKLLSFTAKNSNGNAELNWATSSEFNSSYFEVQKSLNGVNFEKLGIVDANKLANKYTYTDKTNDEQAYYRLKMVDLDGTFNYSKTISVENVLGKSGVYVYPNAVESSFKVKLEKGEVVKNAIIFNLKGQKMKTFNSNTSEMNVSELTSGTYLVQVLTSKNRVVVLKMFKK